MKKKKQVTWQELRAQEIFEGILNGDCPVYDDVDFGDVTSEVFGFNGDTSDYEIETAINRSLLNNGYEWVEVIFQRREEMKLVKK